MIQSIIYWYIGLLVFRLYIGCVTVFPFYAYRFMFVVVYNVVSSSFVLVTVYPAGAEVEEHLRVYCAGHAFSRPCGLCTSMR